MLQSIVLAAKGFCMGAADVVPGVSGGTMAFILGIYQQLLAAIRSFDALMIKQVATRQWGLAIRRPHWSFIIPLVIGIASAIIFFTRVIPLPVLIKTHPEPIYAIFFGLIVGSIIILTPTTAYRQVSAWGLTLLGLGFGLLVVNLVPLETPTAAWFIFLSGFIAISAMLLPGISGSFILLILNQYAYIMNGIGHFQLQILIPFALGASAGLVFFSRFLEWLLKHFYQQTLLVIIGILIGSLWRIWPLQQREYVTVRDKERLISSTPQLPQQFDGELLLVIGLMITGIMTVFVIHWLAMRQQKEV